MKLANLYHHIVPALPLLWQLMAERTPEVSISHKRMPTWEEHENYIRSMPHPYWYLVDAGEEEYVGAIYLSLQREIGIGILRRFRGFQYGPTAIKLMMDLHPGRFLANINPMNGTSIQMFRELGFKQIQVTYEK